MSCRHDCDKPKSFPKDLENRPGLSSIDYRIGTYSRMRAHMLELLNASTVLSAWTHRGADDPGIALLESAAIVGDILTYYQNLYADEAFLRTARWRESVSELVRLSGYRLAPGVGGDAVFAVKVKGKSAVTVPRGFGFKAQLAGQDETAEFESLREITACPHLSTFHLYRPPDGAATIKAGSHTLELLAVDDAVELNTRTSLKISKGDRILLVPESDMFEVQHTPYSPQDKAEVMIVSKVETLLDRVIITFEGALTVNRSTAVEAYVIGRTFNHFGHNAQAKLNMYDGVSVDRDNTNFDRIISSRHSGSAYYSSLSEFEMPLDQEVDDLALGNNLICQGVADFKTASGAQVKTRVPFTVVKKILQTHVDSLQWANVEGSTTVVTLDKKLMFNDDIWFEEMDIRRAQFHEAISPKLTLGAGSDWSDGKFSNGALQFFGTYREAKALSGRDLLLADPENKRVQAVKVTDTVADFSAALKANGRDRINKWMWDITIDQVPDFDRRDFDRLEPVITVYGNIVAADQGKTQSEGVLGTGDNRQTFQTFAIPKAPLTYLLDETRTPSQVPELTIYVGSVVWQQVESFFGCTPDDCVYVVREDDDGKSWVQFGDGKTGARLPSGTKNVTAIFRIGTGAAGSLETKRKPSAVGKLKELEEVFLPGPVVGGDEPESEENARQAAPGKLQSLGRMVGVADFEAEAMAIPGVLKVRADWAAPNGSPLLRITVLTRTGTSAALNKVRDTMKTYNRCRGPARFPLLIEQGIRQFIYVNLRVGYVAGRRKADMETAVKKALAVTGEEGNGIASDHGLFSLKTLNFGRSVHISRIIGAVQQVDGVSWVEVDAAQSLDLGDPVETEPGRIARPVVAVTDTEIACRPTGILTLYTGHFDLGLTMDDTKKECEQ